MEGLETSTSPKSENKVAPLALSPPAEVEKSSETGIHSNESVQPGVSSSSPTRTDDVGIFKAVLTTSNDMLRNEESDINMDNCKTSDSEPSPHSMSDIQDEEINQSLHVFEGGDAETKTQQSELPNESNQKDAFISCLPMEETVVSTQINPDCINEDSSEKPVVGKFKKIQLFEKRKKMKKSLRIKKRSSDESNSDSSAKESNSNSEENDSQPGEAKKQKRSDEEFVEFVDSDAEDQFMDAKEEIDDDTSKRKEFERHCEELCASSDSDVESSSSDSETSSEEEKERKEKQKLDDEDWLTKDIKSLMDPPWKPHVELRNRQTAFCNNYWPVKVCGSRAMVQRFQLHAELEKHLGCVNALHFNQSGTLLASGSDDLKVMLWNWIDSKKQPVVAYDSGHRSNIFQAKFLPDCGDSTVVSSARDGQVRVADISTTGSCRGTKKVAQHRGSAHKLSLDVGTRSSFMSCGEDGAVFGIDLRLDKPSTKLITVKSDNRKIPLYSIHTNPSRPYEFAVSGRDENARIFDRRMLDEDENTEPVKLYCPHHIKGSTDAKANVTCLVYNWDGSELLCSYNDEDIYLFDTSHSSEADYIRRYKGHRNNATVKGVNFYGPRSEFVVSGSDCGNIFFWDKNSSRVVTLVEGDNGGVVNVLEPHPNLPVIATSGLDHEVKIWTPTADPTEDFQLSELKKTMLSNRREREEERTNMPDMIDGHMLWFLMRSLRNRSRRRHLHGGDNSSSDDDTNSSDSSDDSTSEPRAPQCAQS